MESSRARPTRWRSRFGTGIDRLPTIGPWQTQGRSDIGFEDMVKLDYTYVTNPSFAEDMKLLADWEKLATEE